METLPSTDPYLKRLDRHWDKKPVRCRRYQTRASKFHITIRYGRVSLSYTAKQNTGRNTESNESITIGKASLLKRLADEVRVLFNQRACMNG